MLPFDNKSEFQVIINMPEGRRSRHGARHRRARAGDAPAAVGDQRPELRRSGVAVQLQRPRAPLLPPAGAAPGRLQVNLLPKEERSEQSHDIAKRVREALAPLAAEAGARIQVAEVPPGPPVLQTLVAEVYGPDPERRLEVAKTVRDIFSRTPGVVDVDWYVEAPQSKITIDVDAQKAAAAGVNAAALASLARMAGAGEIAGILHDDRAGRRADRAATAAGRPRIARRDQRRADRGRRASLPRRTRGRHTDGRAASVYHKNLQPVTYVLGDVAGRTRAPSTPSSR